VFTMSERVGSLRQIQNPEKVKKVYWHKYSYLIVYDENVQVPPNALEIPFQVKSYEVYVCSRCGARLELDADEWYCPRHGDDMFPRRVKKTSIFPKIDENDIISQVAFILTKRKWKVVEYLYKSLAGGFYPKFKINWINEIPIPLPQEDGRIRVESVDGYAIVQNPEFEESHWDESSTQTKTYEGEYLVLDIMGKGYYLLRGDY